MAIALAVMLLFGACGSTATEREASSSPDESGEFDVAGPARDTPSTDEGIKGEHVSSPTTGSAPGATTGGGAGARSRSDPSESPSTATAGQGFSATEILVGYATFNDADATAGSFGADRGFGGRQEEIARAVIADINDRGGVAGRKIVPVFHDFKTAQVLSDGPSAAQAACSRWTEDNEVFAVIDVVSLTATDEPQAACLAKRQTPQVTVDLVIRPQSMYSRFEPYLYGLAVPALERFVPGFVQRIRENRYFDGWDTTAGGPGRTPTKIGILAIDNFHGDLFTEALRQELQRHGQSVAATYNWSGNLDSLGADMSAAVLRFREKGVTHVIDQGVLQFFGTAAESQRYRPRYAVHSMQPLRSVQMSVPKEQLTGAVGIGWHATTDVDDARDPGDEEARARCRQTMQKARLDTSNRDRFWLMVDTCDAFEFLVAAIGRGGVSPSALKAGAQAMGLMPAASTFGVSFPGGRFDGASAVRDLVFRADCGCFAYLSSSNYGL